MATVFFTRNLMRFFPTLVEAAFEGATVRELLDPIEARWPGLSAYLIDEGGGLRKHVNIFVDGEMVSDRQGLSDAVAPSTQIHIIQALSGG